ncbi:MAG TPA: HAD family hydrolase [Clostridia bacterium]|nr:HAD family hydrolase [Clostridia bacterium]
MIDTVLFDMGGTLEDICNTPQTLARAARRTAAILLKHGLQPPAPEKKMEEMLSQGLRLYSLERDTNNLELKPERIWADFMLSRAGLDRESLEGIAEELAFAWENDYFERRLRPGVEEMLQGLKALGLKLGIVSNTASLYQVFDQLEKYRIRQYFGDVTLSSQVGYRKPHPNIFRTALLQVQSRPQNSVYVGDTVSRDIIGSKRAGFAFSILIHSKLTKEKDEVLVDAPQADYVIREISDVLAVCETLVQSPLPRLVKKMPVMKPV